MITKKELISKLRGREVQLVSKKWVSATEFNFQNWKKSDVEQLLKTSRKNINRNY